MMKFPTSVLCVVSLWATIFATRAAEEPLIPEQLNALLPKVVAGMTREDIRKVLSVAYPKLVSQDGPWSGQSGYFGFKLDEHFSVLFAAHIGPEQKEVVSDNALISVFDQRLKTRFDIKRYNWGTASNETAPGK
jgi:hypothetical protein